MLNWVRYLAVVPFLGFVVIVAISIIPITVVLIPVLMMVGLLSVIRRSA